MQHGWKNEWVHLGTTGVRFQRQPLVLALKAPGAVYHDDGLAPLEALWRRMDSFLLTQ